MRTKLDFSKSIAVTGREQRYFGKQHPVLLGKVIVAQLRSCSKYETCCKKIRESLFCGLHKIIVVKEEISHLTLRHLNILMGFLCVCKFHRNPFRFKFRSNDFPLILWFHMRSRKSMCIAVVRGSLRRTRGTWFNPAPKAHQAVHLSGIGELVPDLFGWTAILT